MGKNMISIIIPIYNAENHLRKCVDSVLAQTYTNLEIILVNDGSTDGSEKVCESYRMKDSRIIVFHKKNGGVSSARNLALEHMQGDYVMFVDSDDWIEKNMCESMVKEALIHNAMLAISLGINRDAEGKLTDEGKLGDNGSSRIIDVAGEFSFLDEYAPGVVWGNLYRRDCISDLRFDEDIFLGEDTLFFARAVKRCSQIVWLPQRFYNYVNYASSAAHGTLDEKRMTNLLAWERIKDLYKDNQRIYHTARGAYGRQCAFFLRRMCKKEDHTETYVSICKKGIRNNIRYMMLDKSSKHKVFYICMLLAPALYCKIKIKNGDSNGE